MVKILKELCKCKHPHISKNIWVDALDNYGEAYRSLQDVCVICGGYAPLPPGEIRGLRIG